MRELYKVFIMKSIMSLVAGGLAILTLAACERSIELESIGVIPDIAIYELTRSGDMIYAVTEDHVLLSVDISTPEQPKMIGNIPHETSISGESPDIAVSGDLVYVSPHTNIMYIVDVSQPSQPVELGVYEAPGYIYDIVIREPYAYLVVSGYVIVVDISSPATPVLVGELDTPRSAQGLAFSGDHAFIADGAGGLFVADASDPVALRPVGSNLDASGATNIKILNNHAYMVIYLRGLVAVDISNPEATVLTDFEPMESGAHLAVDDDTAYVTRETGVAAMDLSDPGNPRTAGEYQFENYQLWITSIFADTDYVIVGRESFAFGRPMAGDLAVLVSKD